jgi:hypothetical protein
VPHRAAQLKRDHLVLNRLNPLAELVEDHADGAIVHAGHIAGQRLIRHAGRRGHAE